MTEVPPSTAIGTGRFGRSRHPAPVVLCDSDPRIAAQLLDATDERGASTRWCRDGASALIEVGAAPPTVLIVADRIDGVVATEQLVATVREHASVPILIGADPSDRSRAQRCLDVGGSAVITRPHDVTVVTAFGGLSATQPLPEPPLVVGPLEAHHARREVRWRGREIPLAPREFDLLMFLIDQYGTVVGAEKIAAAVWGQPTSTNTVAVHVKRLRDKLGADPEHGHLIRTVRGLGYRLTPSLCP